MSAATTTAVLARLRTTTLPVGDARKPAGAGWQGQPGQSQFVTYLIVYPLGASREGPDAPISSRTAAPVNRLQITAVGRDRNSVETAADLAAAVLLGPQEPLDIPGWDTVLVAHESSAGVSIDETVNPPVYISIERFRVDAEEHR